MARAISLVIGGAAAFTPVRAEEPYVHWTTTVVGDGGSFALTPRGEILLAYGGLVKFSPHGELVASNYFEGLNIAAVATVPGGDYYLAGWASNTILGSAAVNGLYVAKFDHESRLLWVRSGTVPGIPKVTVGDADVDAQGSIVFGGEALGILELGDVQTDGYDGPFLCRLDPDGRLLWLKRVQTQYTDFFRGSFRDITVDSSGNILVGGFLHEGMVDFDGIIVEAGSSGKAYGGDYFIAKYSPDGVAQWVRLGYGEALAADKRGNVYARFEWPKDNYRGGIAKFTSDGQLVWNRELPVPGPHGITMDEQDRPLFVSSFGWTQDVVKIDENGEILWVFGGQGQGLVSESMHVKCDIRGNIYLAARFMQFKGSFDKIPVASLPAFDSRGRYTGLLARLSERPPLLLDQTPTGLQLSWPAKATNYLVEAYSSSSSSTWLPAELNSAVSGRNRRANVISTPGGSLFFRLRKTQ